MIDNNRPLEEVKEALKMLTTSDMTSTIGTNAGYTKTWTHWVDQCAKQQAMIPDNRMKLNKENRACFSC